MALTNQEKVEAEFDVIATNGQFTQFSNLAIEALVDQKLAVIAEVFDGTLSVELYESGVAKLAGAFFNFNVVEAQSIVTVHDNGVLAFMGTLDMMTKAGNAYTAPLVSFAGSRRITVTVKTESPQPAVDANPAFTIEVTKAFAEVVIFGATALKALTLDNNRIVLREFGN